MSKNDQQQGTVSTELQKCLSEKVRYIGCATTPEAEDLHTNPLQETISVFKLFKNGDYCIEQESNHVPYPSDEWHGRTIVKSLFNRPDEAYAKRYLQSKEAVDLIERIYDGHSIDYDGHNFCGSMDEDAEEAITGLLEDLECLPECDLGLWHCEDWFGAESADSLGISDDMSDSELIDLANTLESDALEQGAILVGNVYRYLLDLRD